METTTKRAFGRAARVDNAVDTNLAFSRAYTLFVRIYQVDPDWGKTLTRMEITPTSVTCEIKEEK